MGFNIRFWKKRIKRVCEDGRVLEYYESVDDQFPLVFRNLEKTHSNSVKAVEEFGIANEGSRTEEIAVVLSEVDQINRSLISNVRILFSLFTINPCSNEQNLNDQIGVLLDRETKLRNITVLIKTIVFPDHTKNSPIVDSALNQAKQLLYTQLDMAIKDAFQNAPKTVEKWKQAQN